MKKLVSSVVSALLVASAIIVSPFGVQAATAAPADIQRIIQDTNDFRAENGLPPLIENTEINSVAGAWAQAQSDQQSSYHNPDYVAQMPAGWNRVGENVGHGFGSETIVDAWINSPTHRANLLGNYSDVGIGYVVDGAGHTWITQNLAYYPPTVSDAPSDTSIVLASSNSVTVNWVEPAFDGRSAILKYNVVLVNTKDNSETVLTVDANTFSANYGDLLPGTTYEAYVVANNAIGDSVESNTTAVVKVPAVVSSGLTAPVVASDVNGIKVTWVAPSNLGGADVTGYDVTLTPDAGAAVVTSFAGDTLSAVVATVEPGVYYAATYVAKNEAGSSAVSAASSTIMAPLQAPSVVEAPLAVLAGADGVNVTWAAPVKNGGSVITGYVVNLIRTFDNVTVTKNVSTLDAAFTGLNPGAEYVANVTALNAIGESGVSVNSNATLIPAVVASAPAAPKVVLSDENQVTVNWVAPTYDGGADITGYVVTLVKSSGEIATATVSGDARSNVFSNLDPNGKYTATVVAVNSAGNSMVSESSIVVQIPPEPTQPDPINTLKVSNVTSTTLDAAWKAPFNGGAKITGYVVSVFDDNNNLVETYPVDAESTSTTVTGLTRATNYVVKVSAENKYGAGFRSNSVDVKTLAEKPSAPLNTVIVATGGSTAEVTWDAPADNGGSTITTYTVDIYNNGSLMQTGTVTTQDLMYVATNLVSGSTYSASVTAYNQNAISPASVESNTVKTFTVSDAPTNVVSTVDTETSVISVVWDAPVNNGGARVTEYSVSLTDGNGKVVTKNATTASSSFSGLTPGAVYTVAVKALNSVGYSVSSAQSNSVKVPAVISDAPSSVKVALNSSNAVNVSWVAPGYTGGATITGYKVVLVPADANENNVVFDSVGSATNHVFENLTPGNVYSAKVLAVNEAGESVYKNSSTIAIPAVVPSSVKSSNLVLSSDNTTLDASWVAPASNGGSVITGYKAVLSGSDGTMVSSTVDALTVSFTTLTRGVTYTLTVFAVNSVGYSAEAATSNSVKVPAAAPAAPTKVNVTANDSSSVTVTWVAPVETNGAAITGYTVTLSSNGVVVSSQVVTGDKLQVVFTGLSELTGYDAVVTAMNEAGSSVTSDVSVSVETSPASAPEAVQPDALTSGNAGDITAALDGETLSVDTNGEFAAGDWVFGYAYSTPFALGWTQVQADGSVQWDISAANLEAGAHRVALYDVSGALVAWTGFTVAAAPVVPPVTPVTPIDPAAPAVASPAAAPVTPTVVNDGNVANADDSLAQTGANVSGVIGAGLLVIFLGGALLAASFINRRKMVAIKTK